MENTITISISEYKALVAKAERIAATERLIANVEYVSTDDIKAVLNICTEKEIDNEAV